MKQNLITRKVFEEARMNDLIKIRDIKQVLLMFESDGNQYPHAFICDPSSRLDEYEDYDDDDCWIDFELNLGLTELEQPISFNQDVIMDLFDDEMKQTLIKNKATIKITSSYMFENHMLFSFDMSDKFKFEATEVCTDYEVEMDEKQIIEKDKLEKISKYAKKLGVELNFHVEEIGYMLSKKEDKE